MKNLKARNNLFVLIALIVAAFVASSFVACKGGNSDVNLEPEAQKTYTVTFNTNGGNAIEAKTVDAGKTVSKPKNPVRTGAVFEGWYSDSDFKTLYSFKTPVNSNLTLYAKWKVLATYTVTFDTNGGNSIAAVSVIEGKTPEMPEDPVKEGYTFKGWFCDKDLTEPYYASSATSNLTLYASWVIKVFTVSFETEGGSIIANQKVQYGNKATLPTPYPTRKNCTFNGWYKQKYTGTDDEVYDFNTPITKNTTIYAGWIIQGWTVTFETNGGSSIPTQVLSKSGNESAAMPLTPTKKGYNFQGWFTEPEFENLYEFGFVVTQDIVLYARWGIQTFDVEFYVDGNTWIEEVDYRKKVTKPEDPQVPGYDFTGWYTESGELFDFRTAITSDLYLKAGLEKQFYEVSFVTNCETELPSQTIGYGGFIEYGNKLEYTGWVFAGWYTDPSFDHLFDPNEDCSKTPVSGPLTLYAKWTEKICTVTFVTFSGENIVQEVVYGKYFSVPQGLYKGNYFSFDGWYWDIKFKNALDERNLEPVYDDCTLYAKWISTADVNLTADVSISEQQDITGYYETYMEGASQWIRVYLDIATGVMIDQSCWSYELPDGSFTKEYEHTQANSYSFPITGNLPGIYIVEWKGQINGEYEWYSCTWLVTIKE